MKIHCFGNEFIKEDSLAKVLISEIQIPGVEFIVVNSIFDLTQNCNKPLMILDVVAQLDKTTLFTDINKFTSSPKNAHDIDLGFYLLLLKEAVGLKEVRIIGIPAKGDRQQTKKEIIKLIHNLLPVPVNFQEMR